MSELISEFVATRRQIVDLASSLAPPQQDAVFLGVWSVKDLLAHFVGWDYANMEAVEAIRAGRLPAFYAQADCDWAIFNAGLVAEYGQGDFADLLASAEASHGELVGLLKAIPLEEFDKDFGVRYKGYRVTIARTIRSELRDEKRHFKQLKEFKESGWQTPTT
jgi:hypothetical protein